MRSMRRSNEQKRSKDDEHRLEENDVTPSSSDLIDFSHGHVASAVIINECTDDALNQRQDGNTTPREHDVMCLQGAGAGDWMMNQPLQSSEREARGERDTPYMVEYNHSAEVEEDGSQQASGRIPGATARADDGQMSQLREEQASGAYAEGYSAHPTSRTRAQQLAPAAGYEPAGSAAIHPQKRVCRQYT